jgi:transcriptional regulator with XRE-family HTH domain
MPEPNYDLVRQRLVRTRRYRGLNLRDAAEEMGLSAPTLSRIERGASRPDHSTLDALIDWLRLDRAAVFSVAEGEDESTPDQVDRLLRADRNIDTGTAEALSAIFRSAYDEFSKRDR